MTTETQLLTYKYRLNPERRQHRALESILEQQRQLYNAALEERILAWNKGTSISEAAQSRSLTQIRADDPSFAGVQRRIQRQTLKRLDRAYKSFFRRAKQGAGASSGFPKFKGRDWFNGFAFDAFLQIDLADSALRFAGMPGKLRVHFDRPLPGGSASGVGGQPPEGGSPAPLIKGVWFKREGVRWYVGFQVEAPVREDRHGLGKGEIGVDWGTSVLAALSTGETIPNPRHGEALAADLKRAQRAVARKKKGSRSRLKARRHKQAIERRIANRRRNTMDKVSSRLVKHYAGVAFEEIAAKGLMNAERPGEDLPRFVKRRRNREALDAAPFMLRQMLAYKAKRERAELIVVDPTTELADGFAAQPTQRCSMCGHLHFKELSDADHVCTAASPFQNLRLPRKVNAARVILQVARGQIGISPLAGGSRGGPVPGGLSGGGDTAAVRNARNGARRLGNTEEGQPSPGRRAKTAPLPIAHARDPRLRRPPDW